MDNRYLTTPEAAERLGLSRHTLNVWRRLRRGPAFVRLGRAVRYSTADLATWARENRETAGAVSEVARG